MLDDFGSPSRERGKPSQDGHVATGDLAPRRQSDAWELCVQRTRVKAMRDRFSQRIVRGMT